MLDVLGILRPPTRGELKVILLVASGGCFALGIFAVIAGLKAPPAKALLAQQAIFYGCACLFFSIVFALCLWLYCRFTKPS
jgi:hypothetical protein